MCEGWPKSNEKHFLAGEEGNTGALVSYIQMKYHECCISSLTHQWPYKFNKPQWPYLSPTGCFFFNPVCGTVVWSLTFRVKNVFEKKWKNPDLWDSDMVTGGLNRSQEYEWYWRRSWHYKSTHTSCQSYRSGTFTFRFLKIFILHENET